MNILLAAAAYNFKRAMRVLLNLLKRISEMLSERASMNDFSLSKVMSEKVCKILLVLAPMLGVPKHGGNL